MADSIRMRAQARSFEKVQSHLNEGQVLEKTLALSALFIFVFDLVFAALNYTMQINPLVYANGVHALVMMLCFVMIRQGHFTAARIVFGLSLNLLIFAGVDVLGFSSGAHLFYVPLLILPFVVYSRKEPVLFAVFSALPVFLYGLSLGAGKGLFLPELDLAVEEALLRTHSTMGTVFVCVFALLYYYYWLMARAEEAVNERQAEMLHMKQLSHLGEVSSSIAQEILRPTQSLLGRTQTFKKQIEILALDAGEDSKSTYSFCEEVEVGLTQIREITSSLRILSQQQGHIEQEDLKLNEVVHLAARLLKPRLEALGAKLRVEVPPQVIVGRNRAEWVRIIHSLLENSVDALEVQALKSRDKSSGDLWVMVGAFVQNNDLIIKFMDSGAGVDPQIRDRLMVPFFTTKKNGSGLGLSVTKTFAEKIEGTFFCDTEALNTTFVMKIPLKHLNPQPFSNPKAS